MTDVAILIPVLERPHRIAPLLMNIALCTPEPHRILFAVDRSETATIEQLQRFDADYILDDGDTWPRRINKLFSLTSEPYLMLGADDILFQPGWLPPVLKLSRIIGGVVTIKDELNDTHCMVSRRYIEQEGGSADGPGTIFHPGYFHNWCDEELFALAKKRKRFFACPFPGLVHLHYLNDKASLDDTYQRNVATEPMDHILFIQRRSLLW